MIFRWITIGVSVDAFQVTQLVSTPAALKLVLNEPRRSVVPKASHRNAPPSEPRQSGHNIAACPAGGNLVAKQNLATMLTGLHREALPHRAGRFGNLNSGIV
jgi:hypothetical protein